TYHYRVRHRRRISSGERQRRINSRLNPEGMAGSNHPGERSHAPTSPPTIHEISSAGTRVINIVLNRNSRAYTTTSRDQVPVNRRRIRITNEIKSSSSRLTTSRCQSYIDVTRPEGAARTKCWRSGTVHVNSISSTTLEREARG